MIYKSLTDYLQIGDLVEELYQKQHEKEKFESQKRKDVISASSFAKCPYKYHCERLPLNNIKIIWNAAEEGTSFHEYIQNRLTGYESERYIRVKYKNLILSGSIDLLKEEEGGPVTIVDIKSIWRRDRKRHIVENAHFRQVAFYSILYCLEKWGEDHLFERACQIVPFIMYLPRDVVAFVENMWFYRIPMGVHVKNVRDILDQLDHFESLTLPAISEKCTGKTTAKHYCRYCEKICDNRSRV